MLFAGCDHVVLGLLLLQHEPLHLDIIAGMSPVPFGVEISEMQALLKSKFNSGEGTRDLSGNEGFATYRRLVIEQNSVAGINSVRFAIVDGDPVGVKLSNRIG